MRTSNSSTKGKRTSRKTKRAILYSAVFGAALIAITLAITLPLVLGGEVLPPPIDYVPGPGIEVEAPPPNVPSAPAIVLPIAEGQFTMGKLASLDRLVFHASMNQWRTHNGVDFRTTAGTEVRAIKDGTVLSVEHTILEASVVTIQHANGLMTVFKGLDTDVRVESGETVKAGDAIGSVAAVMPRKRSEGPVLHMQMRQNGNLINPLNHFPELANK